MLPDDPSYFPPDLSKLSFAKRLFVFRRQQRLRLLEELLSHATSASTAEGTAGALLTRAVRSSGLVSAS